MGGVDEVVSQGLVHVVDQVQPLWGDDGVLLPVQVARERQQADLVWRERARGNEVWNRGKSILLPT